MINYDRQNHRAIMTCDICDESSEENFHPHETFTTVIQVFKDNGWFIYYDEEEGDFIHECPSCSHL